MIYNKRILTAGTGILFIFLLKQNIQCMTDRRNSNSTNPPMNEQQESNTNSGGINHRDDQLDEEIRGQLRRKHFENNKKTDNNLNPEDKSAA